MSDIQAGTYKGRAVVGSEQVGATSGGHDQIAIDLDLPEIGKRLTTFLIFSDKSAAYSFDRLKACGWDGSINADGTPNLATIGTNEVDVLIQYKPKQDGSGERMEVSILTGGGRIKVEQYDANAKRQFGARFRALQKMHGNGVAVASAAPRTAPNGGARPPALPASGVAGGDDEIPF